jgi:hypothetical protein
MEILFEVFHRKKIEMKSGNSSQKTEEFITNVKRQRAQSSLKTLRPLRKT